jgi:hypothetical protein
VERIAIFDTQYRLFFLFYACRRKFYEDSDKYPLIGVLAGSLYDKDGNPTDEMKIIQERIETGRVERDAKKAETEQKIKDRKARDAAKNSAAGESSESESEL